MQDNFEENKSPEDEGYSYPKKASIPIKFSEDEDKSLDDEDVLEVDMGTKEDSEKRTNKFLTVSYINIFCIIYIECRLMEVCCGWIIFQIFCISIG